MQLEKCEAETPAGVLPNTAALLHPCNGSSGLHQETWVTVMLRCLNCGFSFTVTYPTGDPPQDKTRPMVCGGCRSTHWSSQTY
jgi:hypothetical protein